ncbi:MAG: hypothetical protein J6A37_06565 [Oscillospiraceae bacterium]|nr:hypothetical protein [Oscillospiraceae bacterium]
MKSKLIIICILSLCLIIGLTACSAVQVNERIFVSLMGIEEDNGLCELSVQAYSSTESGKDSPVPKYKTYSGKGRSFYEAADMIKRESGRELFFGHCGAVFLDDDFIRSKDKLRMLAGERISAGCPVILSEEPADEVEREDDDDNLIGSEVIISSVRRYADEGLYSEVTLRDVTAAADSGGIIIVPLSDEHISGAAAVDMSGKTVYLDLSETAAVNLLRGEQGIQMSIFGGSLSVNVSDMTVYFRQDNNRGEYSVKLVAEGILDEPGDSDNLDEYRHEAERIISGSTEAILEKAERNGFLSAVLPKDYAYSEGYENVDFTVETILEI